MARYISSFFAGENDPRTAWIEVDASVTINEGDIVDVNPATGLVRPAQINSSTVVGVAAGTITTGASPVYPRDRIPITLAQDAIIRINYTGSTKTSLTLADRYVTQFNFSDQRTLNLDNTTNGMMQVYAFDNVAKTADVVYASQKQYIK